MNYAVLSGKGGVGVSTVAIFLAKILGKKGRVLLLDGNFGKRCLDYYLAVEEPLVYDLYDVLMKGQGENGVRKIETMENVDYIAASLSKDISDIRGEKVKEIFHEWNSKYDSIVLDCSMNILENETLSKEFEEWIVVSSVERASLKIVESLLWKLRKPPKKKVHTLVNGVRDSEKLNRWLQENLTRFGEYHIIPWKEDIYEHTASLGFLPLDGEAEYDRILSEFKSEMWNNPVIKEKNSTTIFEKIFGNRGNG